MAMGIWRQRKKKHRGKCMLMDVSVGREGGKEGKGEISDESMDSVVHEPRLFG
jgi:hypothetical protein